jgi:hypothetical protein
LPWADEALHLVNKCEIELGLDDEPISGKWAEALFQGKEIKQDAPPPVAAKKSLFDKVKPKKSLFGGLKP